MRIGLKRSLWGVVFFFCLAASATADDRLPSDLIVKLRPGVRIGAVAERCGFSVKARLWNSSVYRVRIPPSVDRREYLTRLGNDSGIEKARSESYSFNLSPERDGFNSGPIIFRSGRDFYERQRALSLLGVKQAHQFSRGAGSLVAIIDTGCDLNHPILRDRISSLSYDFVDFDARPEEVPPSRESNASIYGHGTFAAGITALAAPEAELMILRAFDQDGLASDFDVANALRYAADYGATVINLSSNSLERDELVTEALAYARMRGAIVVVAAGNDNLQFPIPFPAGESQVLAVAATDLNDVKAKFSNYGMHIACAAPGTGLFSTYPGGLFAEWSGTSFAAPWVSACMALLRSGGSVSEQRAALAVKAYSVDVSRRNPTFIGKLGSGRISMGNALRSLKSRMENRRWRLENGRPEGQIAKPEGRRLLKLQSWSVESIDSIPLLYGR